jgi:DNA-directed RNA polymerase subunit E'/Rpb7
MCCPQMLFVSFVSFDGITATEALQLWHAQHFPCEESRGSWKYHACDSYMHCNEAIRVSIARVSYVASQPIS